MRYATEHPDAVPPAAELDSVLRGGPFHVALRAAIAARGLPLQRVRHHLSRHGVTVGVTSLSYWQQGARRPQRPESLRAVRALEEILRLPDESLIRLLAEADGPAPDGRGPSRSYRSLVAAAQAEDRLRAELGRPADAGLHLLGHHEHVRIGAARELAARDCRYVVRAHREGVDRFVAVHRGDPGCDPARVTVHALENCRTGRVRWDAVTGVLACELLFDTRLRTGDTHLFRYAVEDGTAGVSREYVHASEPAGGQYTLQVRFDRAALPTRCHRFSQPSPAAPRTGRRDLVLGAPHLSVHTVEPRLRPGLVGIAWDWE
ncbi:hypothetical protein KUM39_25750 [Streptomyces sp. J2-1]|uniref:hypothetical protein n=1 Tax=Streptomyces corallincola TaxID=2851888 RepID=UPI001C38985E|nr:hypothetical protein [Streptomyces corallincola]MBV2357719.1 hypothetical protein [Streptomyces corallincola]